MNCILSIIQKYNINKKLDLYLLYKHLTSKYWKEDVDLLMYEQFQYECNNELSNKRTKQDKFRKELIDRYQKCIITGNGILICEACHIKPHFVCDDDEKYDVDNGLLMDSSFHKLFDIFMISINPQTHQLEINNKLSKNEYSFVYQHKNKLIDVPKTCNNYLQYHYKLFTSH